MLRRGREGEGVPCMSLQRDAALEGALRVYKDAAAAKIAPEAARALLACERHLAGHGRMDAAWQASWQSSWRRAAAYCVDWKQALLIAATLQVQEAL